MISSEAPEKLGYEAPASARPFFRESTDRLEGLALELAAATRAEPDASFDRQRSPSGNVPGGAAPRPKMRIRLRPLPENDPRAENADLPELPDRPGPSPGASS
jgi:hypothetical protein